MILNEYDNLKEIIVGKEFKIESKINFDLSFKTFYASNLKKDDFYYNNEIKDYTINQKFLNERNADLDNLAKILENLNIKVYRPQEPKFNNKIKTPYFESLSSAPGNVRDLTLIYKNYIIETPVLIRSRYFENVLMYDIFKKFMLNGYKWIKAPNSKMLDSEIDDLDWDIKRDYSNSFRYMLGLDAAQCFKFRDKLYCNIATQNHYLGFKWLKTFFNDDIICLERLADSHIDGTLMPLNDETILYNSNYAEKDILDKLPKEFKSCKFIKTNKEKLNYTKIKNKVQLASFEGMNINVLPLNKKDILVNKDSKVTCELLNKNNFNVIPVQLRHSELFGGGIHCSTLDLVREK